MNIHKNYNTHSNKFSFKSKNIDTSLPVIESDIDKFKRLYDTPLDPKSRDQIKRFERSTGTKIEVPNLKGLTDYTLDQLNYYKNLGYPLPATVSFKDYEGFNEDTSTWGITIPKFNRKGNSRTLVEINPVLSLGIVANSSIPQKYLDDTIRHEFLHALLRDKKTKDEVLDLDAQYRTTKAKKDGYKVANFLIERTTTDPLDYKYITTANENGGIDPEEAVAYAFEKCHEIQQFPRPIKRALERLNFPELKDRNSIKPVQITPQESFGLQSD